MLFRSLSEQDVKRMLRNNEVCAIVGETMRVNPLGVNGTRYGFYTLAKFEPALNQPAANQPGSRPGQAEKALIR